MTAQLCRGAKGDAQASNELRRTRKRVTLRHVRRDREGGAPHLIAEREVAMPHRLHRQPICRGSEVLTGSPGIERLESPHMGTMRASRSQTSTIPATHGAFPRTTFPASRFPFPEGS